VHFLGIVAGVLLLIAAAWLASIALTVAVVLIVTS